MGRPPPHVCEKALPGEGPQRHLGPRVLHVTSQLVTSKLLTPVPCFEKYMVMGIAHFMPFTTGSPNEDQSIRRLSSGRAYYKAKMSEERADMMALRERMWKGYKMLGANEQAMMLAALGEELKLVWRKMMRGSTSSSSRMAVMSRKLGSIAFRRACVRPSLRSIRTSPKPRAWAVQHIRGDDFGSYPVIPLVFNGLVGPKGHYQLIESKWAAKRLPGKQRPASAKYQAHKAILWDLADLRPLLQLQRPSRPKRSQSKVNRFRSMPRTSSQLTATQLHCKLLWFHGLPCCTMPR